MSPTNTESALDLAIRLRQATRDALDANDMGAVRLLNRLADAAYFELNPFEAIAYMAWANGSAN